jgi:MerR family transcriptional regulator, aldehyde-responsive regulator
MNIKNAAAQSGMSVDTIRFYEKAGMMPRAPRDKRGWQNFDVDSIEWLRNLERLRLTGMPLREVRRFAILVHTSEANLPAAADERNATS